MLRPTRMSRWVVTPPSSESTILRIPILVLIPVRRMEATAPRIRRPTRRRTIRRTIRPTRRRTIRRTIRRTFRHHEIHRGRTREVRRQTRLPTVQRTVHQTAHQTALPMRRRTSRRTQLPMRRRTRPRMGQRGRRSTRRRQTAKARISRQATQVSPRVQILPPMAQPRLPMAASSVAVRDRRRTSLLAWLWVRVRRAPRSISMSKDSRLVRL